MEDMSDYETLAAQLDEHLVDLQGATHLGETLGVFHQETSLKDDSHGSSIHTKIKELQ